MGSATGILAGGLILLSGIAAPAQEAIAQDLTLTLRLRDDANLLPDLVARAKSSVTAIYAKAGIQAEWIVSQADILVVILPRDGADKMRQIADAMGFAPGTTTARGSVAYILNQRVEAISQGYGMEKSVVLAAAIAHEVGHLMLPFNAHSTGGLMRAAWNQSDFQKAARGNLLFTPEQAAQIRERIKK